MRRFIAYITTAAILLLSTLSCVRQKLEDPYLALAHIPVSIDWSESLLDLRDVGNVSIYFYPKDGGEPIVKISNELYFNIVEVPVGEYCVLIYNDIANNVPGVKFNNWLDYRNFTINMMEDKTTKPQFYDKQEGELLVRPHSRMAALYVDEFVVDKTMVEYTRSQEFEGYIVEVKSRAEELEKLYRSKTDGDYDARRNEIISTKVELPTCRSVEVTKATTKALEELSNVVLPPKTTVINYRVRVMNLNNAMHFEVVMKGTANGSRMTSSENIALEGKRHIYDLMVTNREYDDPTHGVDGYVNFTLNTFGREPDNEQYDLSFRVILQSGSLMEFERDITDQMLTYDGHELEVDLTTDLDQLVLQEYAEAGFNVDGWGDEIIIPMQ